MAVSRVQGKTLEEYVRGFRKNAEEVWSPELKKRLAEICGELEPLVPRLQGGPERERLMKELDDLQLALVSCDAVGERGIKCMPFFERTVLLIGECRHL
jgi:hypothetical protein